MKNLILRILEEEVKQDKALSNTEIALFKYLNKKRVGLKKTDRRKLIQDSLKLMGLDEKLAKYYSEMYELNYRKNGDYENITKDEFIDPRTNKPYRTTNVNAREYTKAKLPFKGSNLEANWRKDFNGVEYYEVVSYGWYPIYLFKDGIWYQSLKSYSSTTGRQMSQSNPIQYDSDLGRNVVLVTQNEMDELKRRATFDDIIRRKRERLISKKGQYISDKPKHVLQKWIGEPMKVKFKVTDIEEVGDKVLISVFVDDAGKAEGAKMIPSKGGYLRNELPGIDKQRVETEISKNILRNLTEYIGREYGEDIGNIKLSFTHKHEQ